MDKLIAIFRILKDGKYHTASEISQLLRKSDRTIRKYLQDLNKIIELNNMQIESKSRYGYILKGDILDEKYVFNMIDGKIPELKSERILWIIEKLIFSKKYIKIEDLSKEIYVSTKTISYDLKHIEDKIESYNLKISRKPYYGIKITGKEIDIRNLLVDIYEKKLNENIKIENNYDIKISTIAEKINKFLKKNNFKISDISLQNLIIAIYITFIRAKQKNRIDELKIDDSNLFLTKKSYIEKFIMEFENIDIDENDIKYITIHLLSNETLTYQSIHNEDIEEINKLIDEIYFYIKAVFKLDLKGDVELYKSLYTHLLALAIRLRFGIKVKNPLLEDIKNNIEYEYSLAEYTSKIISNRYKKNIDENEIGYIAVILHTAKVLNNKKNKKKIMIICPSGRGVSKFLIYKYKNIFSEYVDDIETFGINDLEDVNLKEYDLIFTLVDLDKKFDVPVYKINYFLSDENIIRLKKILETKKTYFEEIFSETQFIFIEDNLTKEEIIKKMTKNIMENNIVPIDIENRILEREKLGLTEISKDIAIPHPIKPIDGLNFITVAILKHKVKWIDYDVRIVFLLMLDNRNNKNDVLYDTINKLTNNEEIINKIVENGTYNCFIEEIEKLNENQ